MFARAVTSSTCRAVTHVTHSQVPLRCFAQRSVASKMARNRKRAAQHDEEEAANAEERDEFSALARRVEDSEVARKAAKAFEGQGPPGVGTMMAHYFMAGIGVTIAFVLVGVAFRAVGLEPDAEADAEQGVASQVQACATDAMPPPSTHTHHDNTRA